MTFYLLVILSGVYLISCITSYFSSSLGVSQLYCFLAPAILTVIVIAWDGLIAFVIRRLPERFFDYTHPEFGAKKKEMKLYEFFGVKKWKEKVPELGGFTSFHKNKVSKPDDPEYLKRFILEANYGSLIHLMDAILGYAIIFITPLRLWYAFALPVAFVNMVLNLMPFMILRYNVPKLQVLLRFSLRHQ